MSTNFHILAKRKILVVKTNEIDEQHVYFKGMWQTPSLDTKRIMKLEDPIQGYRDFVRDHSYWMQVPVYPDNDPLGFDSEPIGIESYNPGLEHIQELNDWVIDMTKKGYEIEYEVW